MTMVCLVPLPCPGWFFYGSGEGPLIKRVIRKCKLGLPDSPITMSRGDLAGSAEANDEIQQLTEELESKYQYLRLRYQIKGDEGGGQYDAIARYY